MAASPARQLAADLLLAVEERGAHVGVWMQGPEARALAPRDRGLALELALGVLRHRSELDYLAEVAAKRPIKGLAPVARAALRLGLYQLRYLDRVPEVAAVHESVELAKAAGGRAAGFVNAVLRRAPQAPLESLLARVADPLRRREIRLSHPAWLLERWQRRWGEAAAEAIAIYDNEVPQAALRATVPGAAEALWSELAHAGVRLEPGRLLSGVRRVVAGEVTRTAAFLAGRVALQDEASQLIPYLLAPEPQSRVLDVCAAPGGKAAILAELAPNARLLALDRKLARARLVRTRLQAKAWVAVADAAQLLPLAGEWDRILVDPPCSGTGTLQRNPEIRWRLRPEELPALAARQRRILGEALARLAPGGRLAYSVCSIEPEEGEAVVRAALAGHGDSTVEPIIPVLAKMEAAGRLLAGAAAHLAAGPYLEIRPGARCTEGFFAALITRSAGRR